MDRGKAFPAPRFPAEVEKLEGLLVTAGFSDIRTGTVEKVLPLERLQRFYQVPAQSASLYPKLAVPDRRAAVEKMFELARQKGAKAAHMRWKWLAGSK